MNRNTWAYVKRTPEMKPITFTWIFHMKPLDAEGKKFKKNARCRLRSDRQLAYVDYDPINVYASVASHESIRMLFSLAANEELLMEGADISNAYLFGELDVPIIMNQRTDSTRRHAKPGYLCQLQKSFYGPKQARENLGLSIRQILGRERFPKLQIRPSNLFLKTWSGL